MASPLNGVLLVDKPSGMTSHDVVAKVRRILNISAVGHCGTLDPLASGLMVLLVGEGTKISDYILNGDKSYEVLVRFGLRSDTWDADGQILERTEVALDPEAISGEAQRLTGRLELQVPVYSAIKQQGKKLYEYARENKAVQVPRRPMYFDQIKVLAVGRDYLRARLKCSKGGFVRSWAVTLAERLGTGGIVEDLRRIGSEPYSVTAAITLEKLQEKLQEKIDAASDLGAEKKLQELGPAFVPLAQCLPNWKALTIGGKDEKLMSHGQIPYDLVRRLIFEQKLANRQDRTVGIKVMSASRGQLLSLLEAQPFKGLKIRRIFNVQG